MTKSNKNQIELIATCPNELREVLANELKQLGASNIASLHKAVRFGGDLTLFYKSHLYLRTASAIYKIVKEFKADHLDLFYEKVRKIKWPQFFDSQQKFKIEVYCSQKHPEFNVASVTQAARQSIQDSFYSKTQKIPEVELEDPSVIIVVYELNGHWTLSIQTSGKSLHKRGYKLGSHPAPLKETLAAGLLYLADYRGDEVLVDGMCGSGTVAIEAASLALSKAPLIHRKKGEFAFESLPDFDSLLWRQVQEEARQSKLNDLNFPILANDISKEFVDMTRENALRARIEKYMEFSNIDFCQLRPDYTNGLVFLNLPYGVRLQSTDSSNQQTQFNKSVSTHLKNYFGSWRWALLSADSKFFEHIDRKPQKSYKLFNGSIEVIYNIY